MKTLEEFKYYYSNAGKEDLLIEAYEYYTNSHDMTNLVFQLQQEKEDLIKWLEEEIQYYLKEEICRNEDNICYFTYEDRTNLYRDILNKLKESDK